eukprot:COSAG05_NODE_4257_length_1595_cov_4.658422_2_plen_62_part_00
MTAICRILCESIQIKVCLRVYDLGKDSRAFRALKAINTQVWIVLVLIDTVCFHITIIRNHA